jgi:hypothetical protein
MKLLLVLLLIHSAWGSGVSINWVNSVTTGVTGYKIWRADGLCGTPGQTFALQTPTPVTVKPHVFATVPPGTYGYVVTAVTASGESVYSNCTTITVPSSTIPAAPTGVTATIIP